MKLVEDEYPACPSNAKFIEMAVRLYKNCIIKEGWIPNRLDNRIIEGVVFMRDRLRQAFSGMVVCKVLIMRMPF